MGKRTEKTSKIKREFSSGGIVYKNLKEKGGDKILWLITKSTPSKNFPKSVWRFPKGWIDDDKDKPGPKTQGKVKASEKDIQETAKREVAEEGGVQAKIVKKIATEKYFYTLKSKKILKFVTFYLMEWKADLPDGFGFETEKIAWLSYEKARKRLTYDREKTLLDSAKKEFEKGLQQTLV